MKTIAYSYLLKSYLLLCMFYAKFPFFLIAIYHSKSKTEALQCGSFIGGSFGEDGIDRSKSYPMITDVFKYLP